MNSFETKDIIGIIVSLIALIGLSGIAAYIRNNIVKTNQHNITKTFGEIVSKLSSNNYSEMYSSAILLRRYFDKNSSYGVGNTPLAKDTINVIASMLKIENLEPGLQKILADSLKEAPTLANSDFQEVNLFKAVLGKKGLDLSGADFYNANLTNASFKDKDFPKEGVILKNAIFRGAILHNTNFSGADLKGANFKKAIFRNTNFSDCKNLPTEVIEYLQLKEKENISKNIFISHPNPKKQTKEQQIIYYSIINNLKNKNFNPIELEYTANRKERLDRFKSSIEDSDAMIVFDFKRFKVNSGEYLCVDSINENEELGHFSSRWVYLEAGMGLIRERPIFVVTDLSDYECIFNRIGFNKNIISIKNYNEYDLNALNKKIISWTSII